MVRKVSFCIVLLAVIGLAVGCVEVNITSSGALEYKEYTEEVFDSAASLNLVNTNGSIVIEPSTDGKIKVQSMKMLRGNTTEERLREIAGYLTVSYDRSGSILNMNTHYPVPRPEGITSMAIDFRLYVPVNTKIRVKTHNGTAQINGMKSSLDLQTSNGNVTVTNHRGYLDIQTSNGWIDVSGSEGQVDLQSSNGYIAIRNFTGVIDALTSNGAIEVNTNKLVQKATLNTSNDSILFKAKLDRRGDYELESSNGSIEIWLDKKFSYDLYAKTSNGRVQFTFPMQFSGTYEKNFVDGKLFNGSDVKIEAKTSNDDIIFTAWEDK